MLKGIQKQIAAMHFPDAYSKLLENHYVFSFENLARDFPKINSTNMYMFLMYAISQNEDAEKHHAICNYLYFMDPYVVGADSLIRWHLVRALEISPNNQDVLKWIFSVYDGNPDCPFSQAQLDNLKRLLI